MKAIKYTGRIIRLIIVLLAIGLLVNLLVPARSWNDVRATLSELGITSQDLDASSEQENGLEESLLEKFRPLIEGSNTTNDEVALILSNSLDHFVASIQGDTHARERTTMHENGPAPVHLVTLSPCHLVIFEGDTHARERTTMNENGPAPVHLVTLSPCHLVIFEGGCT